MCIALIYVYVCTCNVYYISCPEAANIGTKGMVTSPYIQEKLSSFSIPDRRRYTDHPTFRLAGKVSRGYWFTNHRTDVRSVSWSVNNLHIVAQRCRQFRESFHIISTFRRTFGPNQSPVLIISPQSKEDVSPPFERG